MISSPTKNESCSAPDPDQTLFQKMALGAWRWARVLLLSYLFVLLIMMFLERRLIFLASQHPDGNWNIDNSEIQDADFPAADGTKLHGWFMPHQQPRAILLMAHGNAGNITHRRHILEKLHQLRVTVLIFDYRGYGKSDGSPDEAGILSDTRAARAWLAKKAGVPESQIVLMGRSLGGGVMVDLAARDGAAGLILESTFTSLPDVAATHYPWLPVQWIMKTRLDSLAKISDYQGPLLQSHGNQDKMIPYSLGKALFDAAKTPHKRFVTIYGGDHNHAPSVEFHQALDQFFDRIDADPMAD